MKEWLQLDKAQKLRIFEQIRSNTGLPVQAIEKDYETMQEFMIYKESLPFNKLIERMQELKTRINNLSKAH